MSGKTDPRLSRVFWPALTGLALVLLAACAGPSPGPAPFPPLLPTPTPLPPRPVAADMDPLVREYIELTRIPNGIGDLVATALRPFQQELPNVPAEFWEGFVATIDPEAVYASYAELVLERYVREDLEAIVAFLRTGPGAQFMEGHRAIEEKQVPRSAAWVRQVQRDLAHQLRLKRYLYP